LRFLPWGPDAVLRRNTRANVPDSVLAFSELARRVYAVPEGRDRFYAELDRLLAEVWDEDALVARIEAITATVAPALDDAGRAAQAAAAAELADIIRERRGAIAAARA